MISRFFFAWSMGLTAFLEGWRCWPYQQRACAEMFERVAKDELRERAEREQYRKVMN